MPVINISKIKAEPIHQGQGVTRKILIGPELGPHFAMRQFSVEPGGFMPLHTNLVEHEQYVLQGKAQLDLGEEAVIVNAGDVVFIPAGIAHSYTNLGTVPFEFLCLVPNQEDRMEIVKPRISC
ncbi:MAG: cupin domain-containing protein [Anaerolineaceae bacterium]|nr:cupin domain-containing protein [Anaerolineaceae bacterium]